MAEKSKQASASSFKGASNPRLEDQLKVAMGKIDYLCLADNHGLPQTYQFLTSPQVMQALADSDVKTIYLEAIDKDDSLMIQAYQQGRIPYDAMAVYLDKTSLTDLFGKIPAGISQMLIRDQIPEIATQAKKHGIKIDVIDYEEGKIPADKINSIHEIQTAYAEFMIKKIEASPNFSDLTPQEKRSFIHVSEQEFEKEHSSVKKALESIWEEQQIHFTDKVKNIVHQLRKESGISDTEKPTPNQLHKMREIIIETLRRTGEADKFIGATSELPDGEALEKLLPAYLNVANMTKLANDRLKLDPTVAQRIKSAPGKAVIVYGFAHFGRLEGDIDATLGENKTATLRISNNIQETLDRDSFLAKQIEEITDIKLDDKYNYTLDISTGKWTDKEGQSTAIEIPQDLKPELDQHIDAVTPSIGLETPKTI